MSSSYLQFSEELVLKSVAELLWFRLYLDDASNGDNPGHWNKEGEPVTPAAKFWATVYGEEDERCLEFEWDFDSGKQTVWFHADEFGNVGQVALLVQHFFKEMRSHGKDSFAISWAETCDKMRAGEFGGGACLITKDEVHWLNTWQWLTDLAQQLHVE